jgi:hypothetical protein
MYKIAHACIAPFDFNFSDLVRLSFGDLLEPSQKNSTILESATS